MKGKFLTTLLIGGILFSNTIMANASTIDTTNSNNTEVYSTSTRTVDNSKVPSKSTIREVLPGNEFLLKNARTPTNTSTLDKSGGFITSLKAIAISKSTAIEDYISAKSRIYNSKSSLLDSTFEEIKKASKISATARTYSAGYEAYGNHVYKLAGYKDVYHETYRKL